MDFSPNMDWKFRGVSQYVAILMGKIVIIKHEFWGTVDYFQTNQLFVQNSPCWRGDNFESGLLITY